MARQFTRSRDVSKAISVEELRHMAQRRLPGFIFEYLEGGSEDEVTLRRNRAAFENLQFVPRTLVKCGTVDTGSQLFGRPLKMPLVIAPMGFCGLFAHQGDLSLARAAASAGIPFVQSTVSNATVEEVSSVDGLRHWMQLYVFRSRAFMERLVTRAFEMGCEALVVTADASVFGNREWDRRNYRKGTDPTLRNKLEMLLHPIWMADVIRHGVPAFGNLVDFLPPDQRTLAASATWSRREVDPDLDWDCIAWLRALWPRKLIIKGVLSVEDALLARDMKADGVVLSNHGGRQLDGAMSPLAILGEVSSHLKGDLAILIDSGFRRGTDIVKALALGADAVMVGRAVLYGLAAGGEDGACRAIEILGEEVQRTLALLGRPVASELDAGALRRVADIPLPIQSNW